MNLLSIGGSDPSGGAGIQSDIKTFNELNAHGLTVVTAVTAQNTTQFLSLQPISNKAIKEQLDSVFLDFRIDGIKISMIYNSPIIKTVFRYLKNKEVPIVVDPVIKTTTGGKILEGNSKKDFKKFIVPLATIITPNKFEAEYISDIRINSNNSLQLSAKRIQRLGAKNVVITGIEKSDRIMDFVFTEDKKFIESNKKLSSINHGSGCNYSSALLFALVEKKSIIDAVRFAKEYTYRSIKHAEKVGKGLVITRNKNQDEIMTDLRQCIYRTTLLNGMSRKIPECQTNFVFSKKRPKTVNDIVGLAGRIVKTGKEIVAVGNLEYGGSKHVASAVLSISKKFPEIRSAINLKYESDTIIKLQDKNWKIVNYDRNNEPENVKNKEGSSIMWGIKTAISSSKSAPDIIYHKGDLGKEPMIIVFGKTPSDVLDKIKIITGNPMETT